MASAVPAHIEAKLRGGMMLTKYEKAQLRYDLGRSHDLKLEAKRLARKRESSRRRKAPARCSLGTNSARDEKRFGRMARRPPQTAVGTMRKRRARIARIALVVERYAKTTRNAGVA